MEIIYLIAVFVALTLAAWALEQFFDVGINRLWKRCWNRLGGKMHPQLADPDTDNFTSKFATSVNELDAVLELRSAFFGPEAIVPDNTYRACWRQNPFAFKIVYGSATPLGYWGVVPISEATYDSFVRGELTHNQLLTHHVLRWDTITEPVRLYIIGAVVPLIGDVTARYQSLLKGVISKHVILDAYSFACCLMDELDISGIAGYPSKSGGFQSLSRARGFVRSSVNIGGDPNQPVFVLQDVEKFKAFVRGKMERHAPSVPHWDANDRQRFLETLRSRQNIGETTSTEKSQFK